MCMCFHLNKISGEKEEKAAMIMINRQRKLAATYI